MATIWVSRVTGCQTLRQCANVYGLLYAVPALCSLTGDVLLSGEGDVYANMSVGYTVSLWYLDECHVGPQWGGNLKV
jgi:hypothetical protein